MQGALRLLENTLINTLFSDTAPLTPFERSGRDLSALPALFTLIGSGFLIYACHLWLSAHYSGDIAAVITGAFSFALAACVAGVFYAVARYRQSRIKKIRNQLALKIKSALSALDDEWGDPIRENPKAAILIASLAGFILEERMF